MNGTITIVLLWLVWMFWLDWVNPDELEETEEEEDIEEEVIQVVSAADAWNNPILVASGLKNPYIAVDVEDLEEWDEIVDGVRMPRFLKGTDLTIIND